MNGHPTRPTRRTPYLYPRRRCNKPNVPEAWPAHPERTTDTTRCANCGEPVGQSYVRVFGRSNEYLHQCAACRSRTQRYGTDDVLVNDHAWERFLEKYRPEG